MHDTVTRNHRCRSTHEPRQSVERSLAAAQPFPGNGHGAASFQPSRRMLRRILLSTLSPAVLPGCFPAPSATDRSALYLKSALNAFREVEQALDGETLLAERELRRHEAVPHAEDAANIFIERCKNGLASVLESLGAQNTVFDMRNRFPNIRNSRLKNRVSLALALGQGVQVSLGIGSAR